MSDAKIPGSIAADILGGAFVLHSITNEEQLRARLDAGEDPHHPNSTGWTPLGMAAMRLDERCLGLLIDAGVDPKEKDRYGWTALHWAARGQDRPQVLQMLVKAGCDVNLASNSGITPLHLAASHSGYGCSVVSLLLELGANPMALDHNGKTAAECARSEEARDMINRAAEARVLSSETRQPTEPPRDRRRMAKGPAENQ